VAPTFEAIAALGVPVVLDTKGLADVTASLAERFPELNLIVAHLGGAHDEVKIDEFLALAQRYPNVYLDTSWTNCSWKMPEAIELCGADKVLFGSDGPLVHPAIELMKVRVCRLSREDEEKVLWRNLARLLNMA
jgi:predicted TIM-barrel fold metal-dependent hydrolase